MSESAKAARDEGVRVVRLMLKAANYCPVCGCETDHQHTQRCEVFWYLLDSGTYGTTRREVLAALAKAKAD